MKRILIMNGPNLNLLGKRETEIYGVHDFKGYLEQLRERYPNERIDYFQSNMEGALLDTPRGGGGFQWNRENIPSSSDAPMIQLVNGLIQQAVREGASDIHLEVQEGRGQVRFRVDGLLCPVSAYPAWLQPSVVSRLKFMANMDIADYSKATEAFSMLYDTSADLQTRARALIGLGMVSRNTSDYDRALSYYKEVVSIVPGSQLADDALLAIESIYQTIQQPQKYLEYVESTGLAAGKSESDKDDLYFSTAEQVYLSGNYVQAASSLQKYLDTYPYGAHVTAARFYLAESYSALGGKEKACDLYETVASAADAGSFAESSLLHLAELSYTLERYMKAYSAYKDLRDKAVIDANRREAVFGMMRSAFRARSWEDARAASDVVAGLSGLSAAEKRECNYVKAKSLLATSRRDEALAVFKTLSSEPATDEGAEARYILIQDSYDRADYSAVQQGVFDFSDKSGGQNYWLARAYITLADAFVQLGKSEQAQATLESIRDGYTPERADDDIMDLVQSRLYKLNQ